jgi:dTDP-4-amino-4,6-dideoxygalactose transaminase
VRVADRDAVRARLAPTVGTNIHYPIPVHLQPAYADLGYHAGDFPVAEALAQETLSLPMFPGLTEAQVETVCAALAETCAPDAARAEEAA